MSGGTITPPTFISTTSAAFNTNTATKSVASIAVQNGDVIVVAAFLSNGAGDGTITPSTTSGSTSAWSLKADSVPLSGTPTSQSPCPIWTATATATGNITVQVAKSVTNQIWGFVVKVWRGSDGVGAAAGNNNGTGSGAPTVGVTTTANNSGLDFSSCDWNAVQGTVTFSASNGTPVTDLSDQTNTADYCVFSSHVVDAGTAGAKTMGMSAPNTQRYVDGVVEIKGHATAGGAKTLDATTAGSYTLTGPATTLLRVGRKMVVTTPASYAVAAPVATLLRRGRNLRAPTAGSYTLTGQWATLWLPGVHGAWNKNASRFMTYSNGDRTVMSSSGGITAWSTDEHNSSQTGLYYAEIKVDAVEFDDVLYAGIGDRAGSYYFYIMSSTGEIFGSDSSNTGSLPNLVFGVGDVVGIAYKASTNEVWFKVNNGTWNTGGSASPSTGVGGISLSGFPAGDPVSIQFMSDFSGASSGTINTGNFLYANTPPSGYTTWYGTQPAAGKVLDATTAGSYALTGATTTKVLKGWRLVAGTLGGAGGTWDPSALGSGITLSNGNLSAESTGTVVNQVNKATPFQSSGKYYYEFTINQALDNSVVGIANAATALTEYLGQVTSHSMGIFNSVWLGATSGTTTAPAFVTGHVYGIAIDITNKLAWAKDITAAGNWNANGTADPATGVNGASFSTITGNIYPACSLINANDKITINFGDTAYAGTPPSGFSNWATASTSYSLTAPVATLLRVGRKLVATTAGSYTLTGTTVALRKALVASAGSYTLTGTAVGLVKGKVLAAGTASYTLTGTTVALRKALVASAGAYSIIGQAAKLSQALVASTASYTLTGTAATLRQARRLIATTAGSYAITGTAAGLRHGWVVNAQTAGSYTLTGSSASLLKPTAKALLADPGSYTLTGTAASFKRSYAAIVTSGSYTLTGQTALLRTGKVLTAGAASYTLTGAATTLLRHGWSLNVTLPGNYALTGAATTKLLKGWKLTAGVASYALSGQSVKLSQALVAGVASYTLSGQSVALRKGKVLAAGVASYLLTGQPVKLSQALVASAGSYALTGTPATLRQTRILTAGVASYALAGTAATLRQAKRLTAGVASYTLTGTAAGVLHGWRLNAQTAGSYTLTGQPVLLTRAAHNTLVADPGSYTLTGQDAILRKQAHPVLIAGVGSYILTGQAATLRQTRMLVANSNSYALSGQPAAFRQARKLVAAPASYVLTGAAVSLLRGRILNARTAGSYTLTGTAASFVKSIVIFPGLFLDPDQFFTHNAKYNQTLTAGLFLDPDQFFPFTIDVFYGDTEVMNVPAEDRGMVVEFEDREMIMIPEDGAMEVLGEERTMDVPPQPVESDVDRGMEVLGQETMMDAPVRRRV